MYIIHLKHVSTCTIMYYECSPLVSVGAFSAKPLLLCPHTSTANAPSCKYSRKSSDTSTLKICVCWNWCTPTGAGMSCRPAVINGGMMRASSCPQNLYWQNRLCEYAEGSPLASRTDTLMDMVELGISSTSSGASHVSISSIDDSA